MTQNAAEGMLSLVFGAVLLAGCGSHQHDTTGPGAAGAAVVSPPENPDVEQPAEEHGVVAAGGGGGVDTGFLKMLNDGNQLVGYVNAEVSTASRWCLFSTNTAYAAPSSTHPNRKLTHIAGAVPFQSFPPQLPANCPNCTAIPPGSRCVQASTTSTNPSGTTSPSGQPTNPQPIDPGQYELRQAGTLVGKLIVEPFGNNTRQHWFTNGGYALPSPTNQSVITEFKLINPNVSNIPLSGYAPGFAYRRDDLSNVP